MNTFKPPSKDIDSEITVYFYSTKTNIQVQNILEKRNYYQICMYT